MSAEVSLHYLPAFEAVACSLAQRLRIPAYKIAVHQFPDGENKIQVQPVTGTVIVYASLDNPDSKLIQLALAASAFREGGTARLVLMAPYLCYMRQDKAFSEGEAVSQKVIGKYLSDLFDRVVTVDPHLHRITSLQEVFPDCEADSFSATGCIADSLQAEADYSGWLFVGPDSESEQWVGAIASKLGASVVVAEKSRRGDRDVVVTFANETVIAGKKALIVDDIISSGVTLCRCAEALVRAGAISVEAVTVHMLASDADIAAMKAAGISQVRSTDSILHETNTISLGPLLANILREETSNAR